MKNNLNKKSPENSIFLNAVIDGDLQRVRNILKGDNVIKCNIDQKGQSGNTALMLAIWHHHISIAKYLIEQGADVHHQNVNCMTALSMAKLEKRRGNNFHEVIYLLKEAGAKI